jgi:hypothetical protein
MNIPEQFKSEIQLGELCNFNLKDNEDAKFKLNRILS